MDIDGQVDLLLNRKNSNRSKKHKRFWMWLGFSIVAFIVGTMSVLVAYDHRKEIVTFFSGDIKDVVRVGAEPFNNTGYLGYKLLDNNSVLHMWNQYNDYYFNVSNGIQFSNHYQEYWTRNVLMLGYYDGDEWNLIYRTDELSNFNKNITGDAGNYINATLWKDLSYGSYDFRLAIRYHLGVNDSDLTIIPYIKNLGVEIPYTLGFGWELKDIQIDATPENDYIDINRTSYYLNQTLNNTYTNLSFPIYDNASNITGWTNPRFEICEDITNTTGKYLYLTWDRNLTYKVTVKSRNGQYNAPATLFIRIGTLAVDQEKFTELHWLDATTVTYYYDGYDTGGPGGWETNPGYMVDNNLANYAETTQMMDMEACNSNTCDGTDLGTITKVELRAYGYVSSFPPEGVAIDTQYQTGGDTGFTANPGWGRYIDVTSHQGDWTWAEIDGLFAIVHPIIVVGTVYVSKVEVRVTYISAPVQSNPTIWYSTTGIEKSLSATGRDLTPTSFNITINDADGDKMNITILSNESGSWTVVNQTSGSGLSNGTYSFTNTSWVDTYNTKYWISFNLTDGVFWSNETYNFTTLPDWFGISSAEYNSSCGDSGGTVSEMLDASAFGWYHFTIDTHWFVLDLGQTYTIKKVRGRSDSSKDPIDVNIYIDDSNPPTTLCEEGITTWQDTKTWVEIVLTTEGTGRYIKVEIENTEDPSKIWWGFSIEPQVTGFDAYGDVVAGGEERTPTEVFNYWFLCGNETARSPTQVFDYWFQCGNTSTREPTEIFNYWFSCGNTSARTPTPVFDYWFLCGNDSIRTSTEVFNHWFLCGNETTRTPTKIFDYYFNCGNTSARQPTEVFNYWFNCGNTSARSPTQIFDYWFNCGNTTSRSPTQIFNYWFNCSNTSARSPTQIFDYWFLCGNETARSPTLIFDYWFNCGNGTARTPTQIFDYYFICGNTSYREPTEIFNYWFDCGNTSTRQPTNVFNYWFNCSNESTRTPTKVFDYYFNCGNGSVRTPTQIFDYYFVCSNGTTRIPTMIFNYWFQCGNETTRTPTEIFNYWFNCGNTSAREPTEIFNYWFNCGNGSVRTPTIVFDYYFQCGNESTRTPINVFNYWFLCGNGTARTPTQIFDYYFICGNETARIPTQIFDHWFSCGNTTSRSPTQIFNYWFNCGNTSIRTPVEVFDYWFQCGNTSAREPTEVFDYWFQCSNETTREPTEIFNHWFACGNSTVRTPTQIFDYWFLCGNESEVRSPTNIFNYWFSCGNESIPLFNITITNPYPSNGSTNIPINTSLHFTVNHASGYFMNISVYTGSNLTNCSAYLGSLNSVNNGTYYMGYHNASELSTNYSWRVNVTDGHGNYAEEIYNFTTASTTGEIYYAAERYDLNMVFTFAFLFLLIGIILPINIIRRRKK